MKTKNSSKCRKSSPTVHIKSTNELISSQAGLIPLVRFLNKLGLLSKASQTLNVNQGTNATYKAFELIELISVGICAGARSIDKICAVWSDAVLRLTSGWQQIPHSTVIGKTLKKFDYGNVAEMEKLVHRLRRSAWRKARFTEKMLVVDVDSTQKNVCGNQEGTAKGYNTKKRGAKSYNPQLAFCAQTKEILQGWLRSGNTYTSNGTVEFLKQLDAQLKGLKIFFRADSGYFDGSILKWIEERKYRYLVKVKLRNLTCLLEKQQWTKIKEQPGWEQTEFHYRCGDWEKERKFVAVRRKAEKQDDNLLGLTKYDYFCYVTTESDTPWNIHKKYGQRATCETWIEEAKNQMALGHIKTNDFNANSVLFQCAIIAYNLIRWMGLKSGIKALKKWEPETVRTFLIRTAGKLLTGSRTLKIAYTNHHLHPEVWKEWIRLGEMTG